MTVTDLTPEAELRPTLEKLRGLPIRYVLGRHDEHDFRETDLVIRNPAVPNDSVFLKAAQMASVPVETEASLFLSAARALGIFVVGVSGTKGKTTTATLIAEGFRALSLPVKLTGTPGTSFLAALDRLENLRPTAYPTVSASPQAMRAGSIQPIVVAEFSSWDLESCVPHRLSPHIAVLTSFFPDHLNRHGSMEAYREAKKSVACFQSDGDTLIVPSDDETLRIIAERSPARRHLVTQEEIDALPEIALVGAHQRRNAALAVAAILEALRHPAFPFSGAGAEMAPALGAICAMPALPGRLERIAVIGGRVFVNDTAATNPEAGRAALEAFDLPVLLIAGGEDKGLPYDRFVESLVRRVRHVILLPGTATEKIHKEIRKHAVSVSVTDVESVEEAVNAAWRESHSGDTILFSPAAASFNLFRNEFERGEAFCNAVKTLSTQAPA